MEQKIIAIMFVTTVFGLPTLLALAFTIKLCFNIFVGE